MFNINYYYYSSHKNLCNECKRTDSFIVMQNVNIRVIRDQESLSYALGGVSKSK